MKSFLAIIVLLQASQWTFALDPFWPPEEWEEYCKRILNGRAHEAPVWQRPKPGMSPIVAIQSLIIPEFEVKNASIVEAFEAWKEACRINAVNVHIYFEPDLLKIQQTITHSAKSEVAADILSILESKSNARVKVYFDHFIIGTRFKLDPQEVKSRLWVLSEEVVRQFGFQQKETSNGAWCDADVALKKQGAAVPSGTYADYHQEFRALVAINTGVTLDALSELIKEAEAKVVIQQFKNAGVVDMDGYSLEVRPFQLRKENAVKIGARLRDAGGKLVPFAENTERWARSRGFVSPSGGAAWLDTATSKLWLRSRPEHLDVFMETLNQAELQQ